jgi:hypothetical protein
MSTTPPSVPQEKKGMSCFAIGGIGCLVILVALFLGGGALVAKFFPQWKSAMEEYSKNAASNPDKAAAMLGIKMLPNVVIVREDDAAKSITFKAGPEGEEMTMHYDGLSQGKARPRVTNSKGQDVDLAAKRKAEASQAAPAATPAPAPAPAPAPNN